MNESTPYLALAAWALKTALLLAACIIVAAWMECVSDRQNRNH